MHRVGFMVVVRISRRRKSCRSERPNADSYSCASLRESPGDDTFLAPGGESSASFGGYNLSDIPFVTSNHIGGSEAPGRAFRAHLLKPAPIMTDAPPPVCCHRRFELDRCGFGQEKSWDEVLLLLRTVRGSAKVYFDESIEFPENVTSWRNRS